ncbi:MAG TPA: hypothetical protein VL379_11535 [Pseudomonadales bacterium]|nr:hypothetical protein [Pseudomonadales bacterium]
MEPTCGNLSQRPTPSRVVSSLAFFAAPLGEACDYCLLGQGFSSPRTQTGVGVRVSRRYTSLDSVNAADTEVSNPGVKEKYWTTDVAGFYSLNDRLLVLVNVPLRKTERDGELIDPREAPDRGRRAVDGHRGARAEMHRRTLQRKLAKRRLKTEVELMFGVHCETMPRRT